MLSVDNATLGQAEFIKFFEEKGEHKIHCTLSL
jgi:hypothetical protein